MQRFLHARLQIVTTNQKVESAAASCCSGPHYFGTETRSNVSFAHRKVMVHLFCGAHLTVDTSAERFPATNVSLVHTHSHGSSYSNKNQRLRFNTAFTYKTSVGYNALDVKVGRRCSLGFLQQYIVMSSACACAHTIYTRTVSIEVCCYLIRLCN